MSIRDVEPAWQYRQLVWSYKNVQVLGKQRSSNLFSKSFYFLPPSLSINITKQ